MWKVARVFAWAAVFGLPLVACMREIVEDLPSGPGGPVGTATPSPIAPVPVTPTPNPNPSPTPTIIPTPTPLPTPTPAAPTPPVSACSLPPGRGTGDCPRLNSHFLGDVQASIEQLVRERPELFRKRDCTGCYDVLNVNGYLSGMVQKMGARGYCAMYDGEELAVKNTNDFNEQFDILTADDRVRSGGESYRSTCRPAWF
jgi:hypothetical protein